MWFMFEAWLVIENHVDLSEILTDNRFPKRILSREMHVQSACPNETSLILMIAV